MRPEKTDLKYLWDMLDSAKTITEGTKNVRFSEYEQNKLLRFGVERAIEIIGEAARRVSKETRTSYPHVAWEPIIATRHILAHEYDDIKNDKIWRIVTEHVPALIAVLEPIIHAHPPGTTLFSAPHDKSSSN